MLWYFQIFFCPWKHKKTPSKVAHNRPQAFFSQVRPSCPNQPRIDFSYHKMSGTSICSLICALPVWFTLSKNKSLILFNQKNTNAEDKKTPSDFHGGFLRLRRNLCEFWKWSWSRFASIRLGKLGVQSRVHSFIYSWSISHILEHELFCLGRLGSSGQ